MSEYKHATDRTDWEIIAECPNNGEPHPDVRAPENEHLSIEASATNSEKPARDVIPIDTCGVCGAELDIIVNERATEVLD